MAKSLNDLCSYLTITNNNICLAYASEAMQYCFKFRKQFASTSSFFYRNALRKMMMSDTGYICYRRNYSKYWHLHPTHLTLGECNSLMNNYGASEEQMIVDKILVDQYKMALEILVIHTCLFFALILSLVLVCYRNANILERCKDLRQFPFKEIYKSIAVGDGKPTKPQWRYLNPLVEMRRLHINVAPSIEELCAIKKMPTLVIHLPIGENFHMVEAYKWTGLGVVRSSFKCNRFDMLLDALKDATASFGDAVAVIDTIITFDKDYIEYYEGKTEPESKQNRKIVFDLGQRSQIPRRAHTTGSILRKPIRSALRHRLSPEGNESKDESVKTDKVTECSQSSVSKQRSSPDVSISRENTIISLCFTKNRTPVRKGKPVVAQTITSKLRAAKLYKNKAKSLDNIIYTLNTALMTRSKSTETPQSTKLKHYSQIQSRVDSNLRKSLKHRQLE